MNNVSLKNKLIAPIILTKNIIDEDFGTSLIQTINLQYHSQQYQEDTTSAYEGDKFGGDSVVSLFSSLITLNGSAVIKSTKDLGAYSINLLDSSIRDTVFQRLEPTILKRKYSDQEQQQSIQGMKMNVDDINLCDQQKDFSGPLLVVQYSDLCCSLLDSDDD